MECKINTFKKKKGNIFAKKRKERNMTEYVETFTVYHYLKKNIVLFKMAHLILNETILWQS